MRKLASNYFVEVMIVTPSEKIGAFRFARVPCVGELIATDHRLGILVVDAVVHSLRRGAPYPVGVTCSKASIGANRLGIDPVDAPKRKRTTRK